MIGKLKGVVDSTGEDWTIVDVGGVGYHVSCSVKTLQSLPEIGELVQLAIETYMREDQIRLFGFADPRERDWFRQLRGVPGVGTKVALAILSTLTPSELSDAVLSQDKAMIARSPGVGPKVAQRIIAELKDKIDKFDEIGVSAYAGEGGSNRAPPNQHVEDALSALVNLGYAKAQALAALRQIDEGTGSDTATLIRLGLKELAQ